MADMTDSGNNKYNPIVTIGMPVFNGEKYIRKSIDSILEQTFFDYELLISDNASMDNTESICREYMKADNRIKYNRFKENLGASNNYNFLASNAIGKYFRWSNCDDIWDNTSLEKCVNVLENDKSIVLCYPKTKIIDEIGNLIKYYDDNLDLRSIDPVDRFCFFHKNIGLSNVLYGLMRTNLLRKTHLFGNYQGADIVLIGELSLYGKFYEIPEYLFSRRFHPKSSSSDKSMENQQLFFDPKTIGKISFIHVKHPSQYIKAIHRSPIGVTDKMKLYYYIMRDLISNRGNIYNELKNNIKYLRNKHSINTGK